MKNRPSIIMVLFVLIFGGVMIWSLGCQNSASSMAIAQEVTGEELYISYCKICHGDQGNGSMADLLKVSPPDLTLISARRNGAFPEEELMEIIDGRGVLRGHGTREMPIWGATFRESEGLKSEKMVKDRIKMLVDYLRSIQREG